MVDDWSWNATLGKWKKGHVTQAGLVAGLVPNFSQQNLPRLLAQSFMQMIRCRKTLALPILLADEYFQLFNIALRSRGCRSTSRTRKHQHGQTQGAPGEQEEGGGAAVWRKKIHEEIRTGRATIAQAQGGRGSCQGWQGERLVPVHAMVMTCGLRVVSTALSSINWSIQQHARPARRLGRPRRRHRRSQMAWSLSSQTRLPRPPGHPVGWLTMRARLPPAKSRH